MKILFFSLLLTSSTFATLRPHVKRTPHRPFNLCKDLITAVNYPYYIHTIQSEYLVYIEGTSTKEVSINKWNDFLEHHSTNTELCMWNKFILTDFIFYHQQEESFFDNINRIAFLELRNKYYTDWLETLRDRDPVETKQRFQTLQSFTKLIHFKPGDQLKAEIHRLLGGRSIFNSIFTEYVEAFLFKDEILSSLNCMQDKLNMSQGYIFDKFLECTRNDKHLLLEILGVLSSQRMYLLRDIQTKNLDRSELAYEILKSSSLLYFELEVYAEKNGTQSIYPKNVEGIKSKKPYHFYSVAFIASYLQKMGYENSEIIENSHFYAAKYKNYITKIGIIYNFLLLQSYDKGTVADEEQILREQQFASQWVINN